MRSWTCLALLLAAVGCKTDDREIPLWQDGVLLEGDCMDLETAEIGTGFSVLQAIDPLIDLSTYSFTTGQVISDEGSYSDMMMALNFASWPAVDFTQSQVGAVFYDVDNSCDLLIQGWNVLQGANGPVLDVTFFDSALNCPTGCGLDTQAVLIASVDKGESLSLCRRVVPGCEP